MIEYNELYEFVENTLPIIQEQRQKIAYIEQNTVAVPLNVNKLLRKRSNMSSLATYLETLSNVRHGYTTVQTYQNSVLSSFSILDETKNTLKELTGVKCIEGINDKLLKLTISTKKILVEEFGKIAMNLKNREHEFLGYFKLLVAKNAIITAIHSIKDLYLNETDSKMKSLFEKSFKTIDPYSKMKSISNNEFVLFLDPLFELLNSRNDELWMIVNSIQKECKSYQDSNVQTLLLNSELECTKLFESHLEFVHKKCRMIYETRNTEVKYISSQDLLIQTKLGFEFIKKSESYNNKKISTYNSILLSHGQIYLDQFDDVRQQKTIMFLETEIWEPKNIEREDQAIIDNFTGIYHQYNPNYLQIDKKCFPTTSSMVAVFKILLDYTQFFDEQFHFINKIDLVSKMYKLLNTFNTTTAELVLRANAMNTAKLKKILVGHLMQSYECVHCMNTFIPILKKWIDSKISAKNTLNVFDTFSKECLSHQNKIFEKIIEVMNARLEAILKTVLDYSWDDESVQIPCTGMRKQSEDALNSVFKILKKYLGTHEELLTNMFTSVVLLFISKFKDLANFMKIKIQTLKGKKKFLEDTQHFMKSITSSPWKESINQSSFSTTVLEDIFNSK